MAKKNESASPVGEELTVTSTANAALATVEDFSEFEGDEDRRTKDELVLERFRICQAMTKDKAASGLTDGQIYGSMTRKGFDRLLVSPVHDYRTVVERTADKKGAFVKEYFETEDGSGDFGDVRVNDAIAAAGGLKNLRNAKDGNPLSLTYNCFIAILDPSNGTTVKGFGVLQADKTNIRPYLAWRQNRVDFDGATGKPIYCFRTWVDGKGIYKNPDGIITQQYRFSPFVNENWEQSLLVPSKHRDLMLKLRDQRKLMQSGALKVAEADRDETVSEDAQEEAAF
jgi:hypothetical protein